MFDNFRAEIPLGARGGDLVTAGQTVVAVANLASGFRGQFGVNLVDPNNDDGLLTLGEILRVDDFSEVVDVSLTGVADVNLALKLDLGGAALFPSIRTDFGLDWNISLSQGIVLPTIQFTDVEMNLGEFFGGFAGSVLGKIQDVTRPIQPVIDALTSPVPVISDLAGMDITMSTHAWRR